MPSTRKDRIGRRYGRLMVIGYAGNDNSRKSLWNCMCDCGNITTVMVSHLTCGRISSCGCLKRELMSDRFSTHRQCQSREYTSWCGMKYRCNNPKCEHYQLYGGRGIKVCKRWQNSFEAFLKDMGPMPKGRYSIDRINTNGDYKPSNCRWGTDEIQAKNRRSTVWITYLGLTMCLREWADYMGVQESNLSRRVRRDSFDAIYQYHLKKKGVFPVSAYTQKNKQLTK